MCDTPLQELHMFADQKAEGLAQKHDEENDKAPVMGQPWGAAHLLAHPEADQVETIVRTAWSNARLVAE